MGRPAVFLDRDWTLIEDPGYLSDPQAVRLLPGVATALQRLAEAGYVLIVITNQAGIAKGYLTEKTLEGIHQELRRLLAAQGAAVDAIYYCPYSPEGTIPAYTRESDCRKPAPGMLLAAAKDLDIDLSCSWMVGDGPRDIGAGKAAGCRTIRIQLPPSLAGHLHPEEEQRCGRADFTVTSLAEAAELICATGAS